MTTSSTSTLLFLTDVGKHLDLASVLTTPVCTENLDHLPHSSDVFCNLLIDSPEQIVALAWKEVLSNYLTHIVRAGADNGAKTCG